MNDEHTVTVSVNNEIKVIAAEQVLASLIGEWGFQPAGVAVAVNEDFVPRSQYQCVRLREGDKVDVLAPVQGG